MSADLQHQSTFFGGLPREIRDMIYLAMWDVSGTHQHVFEHSDGGGNVTHFPCILAAGEEDSRNDEFEMLWRQQQAHRPRSLVKDPVWARRMSSTWHEHWKCEEAMMASREQGTRPGTLFLPSLLTCKRMYDEALPTLYHSTTLVLTSLSLAHTQLVAAPSPNTRLWRSAQLSLAVSYEMLHRHRANDFVGRQPPCPHYWAELCGALSNLVRFASLRAVVIRLDLAGANRFWRDVRERWVLSAVRGRLARCLVLQLPELTEDVDTMRPYQFLLPSSDPPGVAATQTVRSDANNGRVDCISNPSEHNCKAAETPSPSPPLLHAERNTRDRSCLVPGASLAEKPISNNDINSSNGGVPPIPFMRLERYQRRRWSREAEGDGVQARLEFFNPRQHVVLGRDRRREKIWGLLRGLLMR
ncbi:hypothetical protein PG999_009148 [Apiospora kogelbergensis]|uniref:DUF7730 domain-containing protein n=2 Tax=Apiospora kogelbergensis TaxID=1337665 RepID=A0AAW0QJX5_9PEZI